MAKHGNFEIRQYAPYVVAETSVTGSFQWVGNVAFRRLADYIFGKNRRRDSADPQRIGQETIAMTAPVIQAPDKQQIAMTAPVTQEGSGKSWIVAFVMPSQYRLESLPEPLNPNVRLSERPGQLMAALRY